MANNKMISGVSSAFRSELLGGLGEKEKDLEIDADELIEEDNLLYEDRRRARRNLDPEIDFGTDVLQRSFDLPLLNPAEEFTLGMEVRGSARQIKRLEQQLRRQEGNENARVLLLKKLESQRERFTAARNVLVERNLRLVKSIARHFLRRGISYDDLFGVGVEGLIKAAEKYDPKRVGSYDTRDKDELARIHKKGLPACRFATVASWWIRQACHREIIDHGRLIRLPAYIEDILYRVLKTKKRLIQERETEFIRAEDITEEMEGLDAKKIREILQAILIPLSLNQPCLGADEEEGVELAQTIPGPWPEPELAISRKKMAAWIKCVFDVLFKEASVVGEGNLGYRNAQMFAEFVQDGHKTLEQIGEEYGCVTRERVRQIIQDVLIWLQKYQAEGKMPMYQGPVTASRLRALNTYRADVVDMYEMQ